MKFVRIPGFDCYSINELGQIYSSKVDRLLTSHINTSGRYNIKLISNEGISTNLLVHRILAFVFLDLPSLDSELEIDHKDTNCLNNDLNNLQILIKDIHIVKTIEDRNQRASINCTSCSKKINQNTISGLCRDCLNKISFSASISAEDIYKWVSQYSWTRAAKELGLSDNGLRKRYTKLTGLSPKSIPRGTARCGHLSLKEE